MKTVERNTTKTQNELNWKPENQCLFLEFSMPKNEMKCVCVFFFLSFSFRLCVCVLKCSELVCVHIFFRGFVVVIHPINQMHAACQRSHRFM